MGTQEKTGKKERMVWLEREGHEEERVWLEMKGGREGGRKECGSDRLRVNDR